MGIEAYIGRHCEACGEGSLQPKNTVLNLKYKGIPVQVECQIPSCTICGASLLPTYLKKEVKEKKLAAYNKIIKKSYVKNVNYNIEVNALVNGEFKTKVYPINPNTLIKGFRDEYLNVTMGELIKSFNKALYILDAPNFAISKRTFIASYVISDLKLYGLIDKTILYNYINSFIPHETAATHIDYMTIIPDESNEIKKDKERQIILRIYINDTEMRSHKKYDYSLLRNILGDIVISARNDNTIVTPNATYVYYTVNTINSNPPIGFTINKVQLFNVYESEIPMDHLKPRFEQNCSIEYLKL